jgi:hypothetical protein
MTRTLIADRIILAIAGSLTLAGTVLAYLVHPNWLGLPALVGINLLLFAGTGFCPMAWVFKKLGFAPACCS